MKVFLKILKWVVIIAVFLLATLILTAQISGNFDGPFFGVPDLVQYLLSAI